jgi:type II secretory pathway pseudopilin PulG
MADLLVVLVVLGLGAVIYLLSAGSASRALNQRERAELDGLRALVDDLKETAWDHRELDSPLSTIIIDKIRQYERRGRELGS